MVKPEMRCVAWRLIVKHVLHVIVVLFVAVQVIGALDEDPPLQEITVAPMIARSLSGSVIGLDHVAVPAGTLMVSPELAAFTQSSTSALEALAATRFGLEPPHAARASPTVGI
jgi:hypothetical protein